MTAEIPPIEGGVYRGKTGGLRHVMMVIDPVWSGRRWRYEVKWARALHSADRSGERMGRIRYDSWEAWVLERVG